MGIEKVKIKTIQNGTDIVIQKEGNKLYFDNPEHAMVFLVNYSKTREQMKNIYETDSLYFYQSNVDSILSVLKPFTMYIDYEPYTFKELIEDKLLLGILERYAKKFEVYLEPYGLRNLYDYAEGDFAKISEYLGLLRKVKPVK